MLKGLVASSTTGGIGLCRDSLPRPLPGESVCAGTRCLLLITHKSPQKQLVLARYLRL
ncbi:hypothetical protein CA51_25090 [Rosistilla oblonga]|nr:hypothetical protein CA51_25090 [Rosistilla oblonga]